MAILDAAENLARASQRLLEADHQLAIDALTNIVDATSKARTGAGKTAHSLATGFFDKIVLSSEES